MGRVIARDTHVVGYDDEGDEISAVLQAGTAEEEVDDDLVEFIGDHCWREATEDEAAEVVADPGQIAGAAGATARSVLGDAPGTVVEVTGQDLSKLKKADLVALCEARGIEVASDATKADLIEILESVGDPGDEDNEEN